MLKLMIYLLLFSLISPTGYAEGKGKSHQPHFRDADSPGKSLDRAGKRVTNELIDAVTDEILGDDLSPSPKRSGMPPGLAKKGKMPPGLAKQGKTPPGWQKANFGAGQESVKKDSLLRRLVRKVFRGGKSDKKSDTPSITATSKSN